MLMARANMASCCKYSRLVLLNSVFLYAILITMDTSQPRERPPSPSGKREKCPAIKDDKIFGLVLAAPTSEADGLEECDAGAGPQVKEVVLRVLQDGLALVPVVVHVESLAPAVYKPVEASERNKVK
jgi:hypothetical protein